MALEEMGKKAKAVSRILGTLGSREKNIGLEEAARALLEGEEEILLANEADYDRAKENGMSQPDSREVLSPLSLWCSDFHI